MFITLSNRCKAADDKDSGISSIRSLKIRDEGYSRHSPVPGSPATLQHNNDQWDLLILKLDKISQKIEMILNKVLFRRDSLTQHITRTLNQNIGSFKIQLDKCYFLIDEMFKLSLL